MTFKPAPTDEEVRALRVQGARSSHAWTEIAPEKLVAHKVGFRTYYVNEETQEAFLPYMGAAFSRVGAVIATLTPLSFVVRGGDVAVFQKEPKPWAEIVQVLERRAERHAARR